MWKRSQIQEYIEALYESNQNIFFVAPTGFGRISLFMYVIEKDLLQNKKNCLVLTQTKSVSDQIQEDFYKSIEDKSIVQNRSKKFILFKNGSLIEFKSVFDQWYDMTEYKQEKTYDILYLDSLQGLTRGRGNEPTLEELYGKYEKIIVTDSVIQPDSKSLVLFFDMVKMKGGMYQYVNIKTTEDITLELRKMKLKKIKKTIILK